MWEVRVSLFRAVTPVSICLASLSKVTCIVLFGLQRLTIDWTKREGDGEGGGEGGEGDRRKQIMCSKCLGEEKEGLLTWRTCRITALLPPHWPWHFKLPKKPQWSYRVSECLMWYKEIFEQKVLRYLLKKPTIKKKHLPDNQLLRLDGRRRPFECCPWRPVWLTVSLCRLCSLVTLIRSE